MKIKWKLSIYILLPLIFVLLTVNIFFYFHSTRLLEVEADAFLLSQAEMIKNESEHHLEATQESLGLLLLNRTIAEYFLYTDLGLLDKAEDLRWEIERDFLDAAQRTPEFVTLRISPPQGKSIVDIIDQKTSYKHYDLSGLPWFQNALQAPTGKTVVAYDVCEEHAKPGLVFAASFVDDSGKKLGVASIHVHVKEFFKQLFAIKIGKHGYSYLVDHRGIIVSHSDQSRVGEQTKDQKERGNLSSGGKQLFVGQQGATQVSVRKAIVPLSIEKLKLIVAQPESEIHAANEELRRSNMLLIFLATCVVLFVSLLVAHQFAGPIVKLKNMALAVGAGDLHAKVDIESRDEIGELAASFNKMVADLRRSTTSIDNLNREIKEREKAEKERIILEQQLRQTQKLECIGTLAAGVAHEINTPIQFIGTNTRFFCETLDDVMDLLARALKVVEGYERGEDVTETLREMREKHKEIDFEFLTEEMPEAASQTVEGIDRVASIVKALKDFSYIGSGEKAQADINKAIENTVIIAQNVWKKSAELKANFDPDLPLVRCSIGEIKQIVLNLIINATHAISEALGAENEGGSKGVISIATRKVGGDVVISVNDNGTGIPEHIRDKIFDPFFTTKDVGQGSGQGLSLAYTTIVDKHKGKIYFETEEQKGTTFFIELPIDSTI